MASQKLTPTSPLVKKFIFDRYGSPYATSSWLQSSRELLNKIEDKYVSQDTKNKFWVRWSSLVINNICNDLLMLYAHEVSGHGFRQRSLGKRVDGYSIYLILGGLTPFFTPVNGLGGDALFNKTDDLVDPTYDHLYIDQYLLKAIAGNEANAVLANQIVLKNFKLGYLDHRNYNLFFKAFTNLLGYIIITSTTREKDDISAYLQDLNQKYNSDKINVNTLRLNALLFFLNPMLYSSLWAFYGHLFKNKQNLTIPCLRWENITYMPLIRIGLTPFGISYYLDNFISNQKQTFLVSLNICKSPFNEKLYGGIGCKTDELYNYKRYSLDISANVWYQPKLLLKKDDYSLRDKNYWGGLVGIHNTFKVNSCLFLNAAVSYKTLGFLEGVIAQDGVIWEAGFSINCD